MDIDVNNHTHFLNGYMDAIGQIYSNDETLCGMSASIIPKESSLENELDCKVIESKAIPDMVANFEEEISTLLNSDPRKRELFYLTEYFAWYEEYTNSCTCTSYTIKGENVPSQYVAYILNVNNTYQVLIYMFMANKRELNA